MRISAFKNSEMDYNLAWIGLFTGQSQRRQSALVAALWIQENGEKIRFVCTCIEHGFELRDA